MANCAQLINCLNSLYLAHEDRFVRDSSWSCLCNVCRPSGRPGPAPPNSPLLRSTTIATAKPASFWGLRGSASLHGKQLVITAVNPNVKHALQAQIVTRGARVNSGKATILTASDIHAHNTFDQKSAVVPQEKDVQLKGESLSFRFPLRR